MTTRYNLPTIKKKMLKRTFIFFGKIMMIKDVWKKLRSSLFWIIIVGLFKFQIPTAQELNYLRMQQLGGGLDQVPSIQVEASVPFSLSGRGHENWHVEPSCAQVNKLKLIFTY